MITAGILLPILNTIDGHLFQVMSIDTQNKNCISSLSYRQTLPHKIRKRTEECIQNVSGVLKRNRSIKQFTQLRTLNSYYSSYYVIITLKITKQHDNFFVQHFHQNPKNKHHLLAMQNDLSNSKTVTQEVETDLDTNWAF